MSNSTSPLIPAPPRPPVLGLTLREAFPVSWALPERKPIVLFLEENLWIGSKYNAQGGAYSIERYPYLREIYEAMTDPDVHWVTLVMGSQMGKSTCVIGYLYYRAANDPTPTIWCSATEKLHNDFIESKLRPAIEDSPNWRALLSGGARAISQQRIDFLTMPVFYALADSEASMSMKSAGIVIADETGKFPANTTNEGSPISQLRERQFTFPRWKFLDTSTPTRQDDGIWVSYKASDLSVWSVPCPACGEFGTWARSNINYAERPAGVGFDEWAARVEADRAGELYWWQCPACAHRVCGPENQRIVNEMNRAGRYIGRGFPLTHRGFLAPRLASPLQTLQDYVVKLIKAFGAADRGDFEPIKHLTIHYDATPYEPKKVVILEESITALAMIDMPRGRVPNDAIAITVGVDVQRSCLYFVAMAWSLAADGKVRAHVVDHGKLDGFPALDLLLAEGWAKVSGGVMLPRMTFVDSGDGPITFDIYRYTNRKNPKRLRPIKGDNETSSGGMFWRESKGEDTPHRGRLVRVFSHEAKDFFAHLMTTGGVSFHAEVTVDPEFQEQMSSEERKTEGKGKRAKTVWRQKSSGRANHLFAATAYCVAAAMFGKKGMVRNDFRWRKQYKQARIDAPKQADSADADEEHAPIIQPERVDMSPQAARRKLHAPTPARRRGGHIPGF